MSAHTRSIGLHTRGFNDVHDLTPPVAKIVAGSGVSNGMVTVFVPGSTAGITTIEFESGAIEDLKKAIERIVPSTIPYDHDERWGDGNGFSHVRAAMMGPSLTVPVSGGALALGTWQQIILIDFDNRAREREVVVTVVGDK